MLPVGTIINGDNVEVLRSFDDGCIDLTVTSPPYDTLRSYGGNDWGWDEFIQLAPELFRVTKPGGVVVWVVNDATVDGSETGTSFRQALRFKDCGFRLHDTMIYRTNKPPANITTRCQPCFEFMFVLSKGTPSTFNPPIEKCEWAGVGTSPTQRDKLGQLIGGKRRVIGETKVRDNIWHFDTGSGKQEDPNCHPAPFPESLARDHILSWSNEGDVVLDPFAGSGTTLKMAKDTERLFIGVEIHEPYCEIVRNRLAQKLLWEAL
jgi:DNA modification methylase